MPKQHARSIVPCLVPEPRLMRLESGVLMLETSKLIALHTPTPAHLFFEAQEAQRALSEFAGMTWHIHAGKVPAGQAGLTLEIGGEAAAGSDGSGRELGQQAYTLDISPGGIHIKALTPAGIFLGVMTLAQLLRQYGDRLPLVHIADQPDFARRGVMLDISRDKVPTMQTLFELVDLLAGLKLNELQLYTEHTFAYRAHPEVWANASPLTGEEIMQLDAYCRARHIDLVPNQNSFGHMRRWLTLDAYRHLAEAPNGCDTRWGHFDEPFTLNPLDPGAIKLVEEMLDEVSPHFSSSRLNVGCDEMVDLGEGASKEMVEELGVGRVYLDFLLKIHKRVEAHGKTMQFWGDIIMEHPELVHFLPKNVVALEWGYEAQHPFADHSAKFAASGVPFYVCPGTSSWNALGGRTDNAIGNLLNAAESGLRNGAIGYLITDWGDNGHLQPLPVSFLPYAYGAAVSWCVGENRDIDIVRAVSIQVFGDPSGATGRFFYDLGNVYTKISAQVFNGTPYGIGVFAKEEALRPETGRLKQALDRPAITKVKGELDRLEKQVTTLTMTRADAALIKREARHVIALIRHGMGRIERAQGLQKQAAGKVLQAAVRKLVTEHDRVWLLRNRPGGMRDSASNIKA